MNIKETKKSLNKSSEEQKIQFNQSLMINSILNGDIVSIVEILDRDRFIEMYGENMGTEDHIDEEAEA